MWRALRITLLLSLLVLVGGITLLDRIRTTDWDQPLRIGIFPIVADDSAVARRYVESLRREDYMGLEAFFTRQARAAGLALTEPARITLYPPVAELPPMPPGRRASSGGAGSSSSSSGAGAGTGGANILSIAWWSLKLRAYARRAASDTPAQIRLFVLYHDPERSPIVPHSLGLQKGLVGVVHAFAARDMNGPNLVVIAHELLHTLGATDKYDSATTLPRFPEGYADPAASPRHPQRRAEIMAGRRALSDREAEMPESLDEVVIGPATAREINWPVR